MLKKNVYWLETDKVSGVEKVCFGSLEMKDYGMVQRKPTVIGTGFEIKPIYAYYNSEMVRIEPYLIFDSKDEAIEKSIELNNEKLNRLYEEYEKIELKIAQSIEIMNNNSNF